MKKAFLMAAAAAMIFASCSQETTTPAVETKGNIVIKLNGVNTPKTRFVDNQEKGGADDITFSNGWVFVFNSAGTILHNEALDLTLDSGDGSTGGDEAAQLLMDGSAPLEVDGTEKIYIIGNLPETSGDGGAAEAARLVTLNNAAAIMAEASTWALKDLQVENKFNTIPVANATGLASLAPTTVDFNGASTLANYAATISVAPLLSRVELVAVQAKTASDEVGTIVSFTIGGVFIDSYYPNFTYGGTQTGTNIIISPALDAAPWNGVPTFEQKQDHNFDANEALIGPGKGTYVAAGAGTVTDPVKAVAATDKVWAYNVPSKGVARLIVYLSKVTYTPKGGTSPVDDVTLDASVDADQARYLTVGSYTTGTPATAIANFARGYIYRIGTATNKFEFGPKDIDNNPNPINGTATVIVDVIDWKVETPNAELM